MLENERAAPVLKFPKKLLMKITHSSPPSQDPDPVSQERAQESLLKNGPQPTLLQEAWGLYIINTAPRQHKASDS